MGLDNLVHHTIILKRCEEKLILKSHSDNEEIPENSCKFQLSSFFNSLENGKVSRIQPSLNQITTLDLSSCSLTNLPRCLKILPLKELNLSRNNFTQIPSCLYGGSLPTLENLDLSFNSIQQFDIAPDCVLSLKRLRINDNCFENVPKWFLTFRCINLEEFNYSENKAIHFNFLKKSFNLSFIKLKKLELRNSCLIDSDIKWLKYFRNLKVLDISNKSIIKDIKYINRFKELDNLFIKPSWKEIQVLILNSLDLPFFPEGLFWIESLKELHISNNSLSWFPDGLEYLVNLEVLNVSNNQLVSISKQISQLGNLKILIAFGNQLEEIPLLPKNLEVLDLFDNYLETLNAENVAHLMYLDIECNFLDLKHLDYQNYNFKRDRYRELYDNTDRCCGMKIRNELHSPTQSDDSDDSEYFSWETENKFDDIPSPQNEVPEENWDVKKQSFVNPAISLSDNEWDGEKESVVDRNIFNARKIYVDDEDWMFIDAN